MNNRVILSLTAVALLGGIALSAWRLNHCMVAESALDQAELQVAAGSYDAALKTLASADFLEQTPSIKERGQSLVRSLVAEASAKWHPVRSLGRLRFDPDRSSPMAFGSDEIPVRLSLHPKSLDRFVTGFTLGSDRGDFVDGQALVRLKLPEESMRRECTLSLLLDPSIGGAVDVPGVVSVIKELGRPQIAFGIQHAEEGPLWLEGAKADSATVLPHETLSFLVEDLHGIKEVTWSLGEDEESKRFATRTTRFSLPIKTAAKFRGQTPTLKILAINEVGNRSQGELTLDLKSLDWNPVARARIGNVILRDDQATRVRGGAQELRLDLLQGIRIEHLKLRARTDGQSAQALIAEGEALVTKVELGSASAQGISLLRGTRVLKTWSLTVDSGIPVVTLRTKEGMLLEPDGDYVFDAGQELEILASDDTGIAPGGLKVNAKMLQLGRPRRVSNQIEAISFTLAARAHGTLEVTAIDAVGNTSAPLTWSLRARHPLQVSKAALESFLPGEERQALAHDRPTLRFNCSGEGKVFVRVGGEKPASPSSSASFEAPFRERVESVVDLKVPMGTAAERLVWLESDDGRRLASWTLLIDRRSPEIRIGGDTQGLANDTRLTVYAGPELDAIDLDIWENSGEPKLAITGAIIRDQEMQDNTMHLKLSIPDELPSEITVAASDHAGNQKRVVLAVTRSKATQPTVRLLLQDQEVPSGAEIRVKHLDALRVSVIHGSLRSATWGGASLQISKAGRLGVPDPLPTMGANIPLTLRVASPDGRKHSYQYKLGLVPFTVPEALKQERKSLNTVLSGATVEIKSRVLDDLARRVEAAAQGFLDQREKNAFLLDLQRIREEQ